MPADHGRFGRDGRSTEGHDFDSLVRAAQAGGRWALGILYREHNPAILRYLRARAGADGDDLASRTWLDAARNLPHFDGDEDQFRGWLFTIARRRLIDHTRRWARSREEPVGPDGFSPADTSTAEDAAETIAGDDAARRIVELLPEAQAEIVLLRVVAGFDVEEVARITGRRPGNVRVMQHRALRRLAVMLGEQEL